MQQGHTVATWVAMNAAFSRVTGLLMCSAFWDGVLTFVQFRMKFALMYVESGSSSDDGDNVTLLCSSA